MHGARRSNGSFPSSRERSVWRGGEETRATQGRADPAQDRRLVQAVGPGAYFPGSIGSRASTASSSGFPAYAAVFLADQRSGDERRALPPAARGARSRHRRPRRGADARRAGRLVAAGAEPLSLGPFRLRTRDRGDLPLLPAARVTPRAREAASRVRRRRAAFLTSRARSDVY